MAPFKLVSNRNITSLDIIALIDKLVWINVVGGPINIVSFCRFPAFIQA